MVGRSLQRAVGAAGELLPASAVDDDGRLQPAHLLSVPVQSGHLPPGLDRGDVVDVYVTADEASSSRRVLSDGGRCSTSATQGRGCAIPAPT